MFNQPLFKMEEGIKTCWASPENQKAEKGKGAQLKGGRKGRPSFPLDSKESVVLAEAKGKSGTIRRIWITISDRSVKMLRGIRLDFYWDGSDKPAVSAPIGDFFGVGLGKMIPFQSAFFSNPEGRSFNCNIPMPFKTGMKLVVTNETDEKLRLFFYDVDYTLGDQHGNDVLYFHACFRRENPTTLKDDYQILPGITGKGRFLGCNIGVKVNQEFYTTTWWGEGEVKVYLDGDQDFPTLVGTGTEDYIGTAWGQGRYDHLYQGCPVADRLAGEYCFYRYHILDPIYFYQDIRVTIQQIGYCGTEDKAFFHYHEREILNNDGEQVDFSLKKDGGLIFERHDDFSSCAYFYLNSPANDLPELPALNKRLEGMAGVWINRKDEPGNE